MFLFFLASVLWELYSHNDIREECSTIQDIKTAESKQLEVAGLWSPKVLLLLSSYLFIWLSYTCFPPFLINCHFDIAVNLAGVCLPLITSVF